ncbi:uncharacterized protein LOC131957258 [Physella acuta]|uniref:uncharacterized protein LOC131957258 n=1 Tax=Physella acuta TaxID=109671 RepID=UPI0027DBAFEA|nr:uncharacterized protein LOC131957258 [Physella acuta]
MPEKHFAELGSAKTINLCVRAEDDAPLIFVTHSSGRISYKTRKVATYVHDVIVTIENITETEFTQHTIYIVNRVNQLETKLTLYKKTPPELCGNTSSPLIYPVEIGTTRVIPLCITSEDILSCTVTESNEEITDKVRCTIENKTLTNQTLTLTFTNITTSDLTNYTVRVTGNQTSFTDLTVILKDTTIVVARDNSNKTTPFNTPLSTTLGILLPVVFLLPAVALLACIVYRRTGRIKQMLQATLCKSKLDVSFNNCGTEDQGEGRFISNGLTYVTIEPSKSTHPKHKTRRKPKTEKVVYATLDFSKSSR